MPSDSDAEPTAEYIRELHQWIERHWRPQCTIDERIEKLALNEHFVEIPDTNNPKRKNRREPVKMTTGIGSHAVELITSLYVVPARTGLIYVGEGRKGESILERAEVALEEARDQLNPSTDSPRLRRVTHQVVFGRGCELTLPGSAYWHDCPRKGGDEEDADWLSRYQEWKRKAPIPILYQDLPPQSTFPPSLGRIDDEVLSTTEMSWWELMDIFTADELGNEVPEPAKRHELVTLGTYANRSWVAWCILADKKSGGVAGLGSRYADQVVRVIEHKMGRCPIRILPGRTSAWKEPGRFWRSALYTVRDMIQQVDERFSEAATASKFNALPWLKLWRNALPDEDNPEAARANIQDQLAEDVVILDAGGDGRAREDLGAVFHPPFGEKTMELGAFGLELIRRMTGATEAIEGLPGPASQTAWARNFTAELAKGFFKMLTDAVVAADIDSQEQIIRAVVAFDEDIILQRHEPSGGEIVLKPSELANLEPILKGQYELRLPQNRRADIEQGIGLMERVRAGDLPIDLFWIEEQFLGIEQPGEMYKSALKTQFLLSPQLKDWHLKAMMEEADIRVGQDEAMSLQQFEEQFAGQVDPRMAQLIRQKAMGGRRGGDLQSVLQQERTFGRDMVPPGPQPQEVGI